MVSRTAAGLRFRSSAVAVIARSKTRLGSASCSAAAKMENPSGSPPEGSSHRDRLTARDRAYALVERVAQRLVSRELHLGLGRSLDSLAGARVARRPGRLVLGLELAKAVDRNLLALSQPVLDLLDEGVEEVAGLSA